MAPGVCEKLAILLSASPAASPGSMRSVSRRAPRPPLRRTTQTAPLGSIHSLTSRRRARSAASSLPMKTRSTFERGLRVTTSAVRSLICLLKAGSSRLTIATFDPGLTPNLSSNGRVETSSGLARLAAIAPSNRAENDDADQPCRIRARQRQHHDRNFTGDPAVQQEAETDEACQHHGAGKDPDHGARYVRCVQTSITCRSLAASSSVPE